MRWLLLDSGFRRNGVREVLVQAISLKIDIQNEGENRVVLKKLSDDIEKLALKSGADMVGFADLRMLPTDYQTGYPFGISVAVALNPEIVTEIQNGPTKHYHQEYLRVNKLLDTIGRTISTFLREKGYRASFSAATDTTFDSGSTTGLTDMKTLSSGLSHKMIATRAGLGWIGKNDLLVTREYGCAVRLNSVLTDAPLPAGESKNDSDCGKCRACIDACPAGALKGETWHPGIDRDRLVDVFSCCQIARELTMKNFGEAVSICGTCIVSCPWTKKYLETTV